MKKLFSFLLACIMLFSALPLTAFAEAEAEAELEHGTVVYEPFDDTEDEYIVTSGESMSRVSDPESSADGEIPADSSALPPAPEGPPVLKGRTDTSITVEADPLMEYSIDGGVTWQANGVFENLTAKTTYQVISRYQAGELGESSEAGPSLEVTTLAVTTAPAAPVAKSISYSEIVVSPAEKLALEYSINNGRTWQTSTVFSGLKPDTRYAVVARVPETDENAASPPSSPLEVVTVSSEVLLVTNEAELQEALIAVRIMYGESFNIRLQNSISLEAPLRFVPSRFGSTLYFDLGGFTLDASNIDDSPIIASAGSKVVLGASYYSSVIDGETRRVEQTHGGTILAHDGHPGILIEADGSLSSHGIDIHADTAIENNGTLGGFTEGKMSSIALVNYGSAGNVDNIVGYTSNGRPAVENYGIIEHLGGSFFEDGASAACVLLNHRNANISALAVSVNKGGKVSRSDHAFINEGTIGDFQLECESSVITTEAVSKKGSGVVNRGTIDNISGGTYTQYGYQPRPGDSLQGTDIAPLLNEYGGVIKEISGGTFTGMYPSFVNYGTVEHVSGGKFRATRSLINIKNYGTISDIYGGWYTSAMSSPTWEEKQWFITNYDSGSYELRSGYQISMESVAFADGTTSGDYRVVGPSRKIRWNMDGKMALLTYSKHYLGSENTFSRFTSADFTEKTLGADIGLFNGSHSELLVGFRDQYQGAYEGEYVIGENVPYYAFDHWDYVYRREAPHQEKALDYGILIVDKDYVSFCFDNKKVASKNILERLQEIPKNAYADLAGYVREQTGDLLSTPCFYIDSTRWEGYLQGSLWQFSYGYSGNGSSDARYKNRVYFMAANSGWKDQDGKLYVTDYPAYAPLRTVDWQQKDRDYAPKYWFRMPEKNLDMSIMYRAMASDADAYTQIWRRAARGTNSISINNPWRSAIGGNPNDPIYHASLRAQFSIDGGETWLEDTRAVVFQGLNPDTEYNISIRFVPVNTSNNENAEDWILPSETIDLVYDREKYAYWWSAQEYSNSHLIRTYAAAAVLPEKMEVRQFGNSLYFKVSKGLEIYYNSITAYQDYRSNSLQYYTFSDSLGRPDTVKTSTTTKYASYLHAGEDMYYCKEVYGESPKTVEFTMRAPGDPDNNVGSATRKYAFTYLPPRHVPVVNISEAGHDHLTFSLVNDEEETGGEYCIKVDGIWSDWQTSPTFTGLTSATVYDVAIRLPATETHAASEYILVTAKTKLPRAEKPDIPSLANRTDTTLTVNTQEGAEYSIDGGRNWQDGGFFDNLSPYTEYPVISRYKETPTFSAGPITDAIMYSTKLSQEAPQTPPVLMEQSGDVIIVEEAPGMEFSIDGGRLWQSSGIFQGLTPGAEYELFSRFAETEDAFCSPPSLPLRVSAKPKLEAPGSLPEIEKKTNVSVRIRKVPGLEYSIDGGMTWHSDGLFEGLEEGTRYQVLARYAETDNTAASDPSPALEVVTKRTIGYDPQAPIVVSVTSNTITLEVAPGQEYALCDIPTDGDTGNIVREWSDLGRFSGLNSDTDYEVITRFKETEDYIAGSVGKETVQVHTTKRTFSAPAESVSEGIHEAYLFGYIDGTLRPEKSMTRAEAAAVLARVFTSTLSASGDETPPFSDVDPSAWYYPAVWRLSAEGIVVGYPDGTFRPDAPITRAEFTSLVTRIASGPIDPQVSEYSDITTNWAREEIHRAAEYGWVSGYGDGTFHPDQSITRAEAVSMINRVQARHPLADETFLTLSSGKYTDNANPGKWYFADVAEAATSHSYTSHGQFEVWAAP